MVLGLEIDGEVDRHLTESVTSGIPDTMVLGMEGERKGEGERERGREGGRGWGRGRGKEGGRGRGGEGGREREGGRDGGLERDKYIITTQSYAVNIQMYKYANNASLLTFTCTHVHPTCTHKNCRCMTANRLTESRQKGNVNSTT